LAGSNAGRGIATDIVAVGLLDTHTATVTAGNRAYADMVGHAAESLAGLPIEALLDPPRAVAGRAVLTQMRDGLIDYVERDMQLRGSSGPGLRLVTGPWGAAPPTEGDRGSSADIAKLRS
jgi:hypothetical protein